MPDTDASENNGGCEDVGTGGGGVEIGNALLEIVFRCVELDLAHPADVGIVRLRELLLKKGDTGAVTTGEALFPIGDVCLFALPMSGVGRLPKRVMAMVKESLIMLAGLYPDHRAALGAVGGQSDKITG